MITIGHRRCGASDDQRVATRSGDAGNRAGDHRMVLSGPNITALPRIGPDDGLKNDSSNNWIVLSEQVEDLIDVLHPLLNVT